METNYLTCGECIKNINYYFVSPMDMNERYTNSECVTWEFISMVLVANLNILFGR